MTPDFIKQDIEENLLGGYLVFYANMTDVQKAQLELVATPDLFSSSSNKRLFTEIKIAIEKGYCDMNMLNDHLKGESWFENSGGWTWLAELCRSPAMKGSMLGYAKRLHESYVQRRSYELLNEVVESLAVNGDHQEKINTVTEAASSITALMTNTKKKPTEMKEAIDGILKGIEVRLKNGGATGLKTGLNAIDQSMGARGIGSTDLIVIGARPKTGKTLTSLRIAANCAMDGKKVLFFSLEMHAEELAIRLMSAVSSLNPDDLYGDVSDDNNEFWDKFTSGVSALHDKHITIEDTPNLKIQQMDAVAKQINAECGGLDLIVVDYIQKAGVNDKGRHDLSIGEISGGLKTLAKDIKVPVVALSQLNRNGTGKPTIAHLRESGQIEQDADAIFLIHNAEEDDEGNGLGSLVEMNMPAYRHGPGAGPFFLDKTNGKMIDADNGTVISYQNKVNQARQQAEESKSNRSSGFKRS